MKTALVLSGGGAKGAYQIGAWKALKKLKIDFDIVTGTSIGALNGALIVQDNYFKAVNLWKRIDFNLVYNEEISKQMKNSKDDLELFTIYLKNSLKGGIDVSNLQKFINNNINVDKILNSKKDFSIVTYNMSNLKPEVINKKKIQKDKLSDYLMASASVFPVFNPKVIDDKNFVDGGYFDNLPINPAIDLGANKVIAIDLNSIGLTEKPKKDIETIHIKPSNKLSNFLVFDKEDSKRDMQLGYNDTMKKFDKLQGDYYSFYNNSFKRNKDKYYDDFIHNLKTFNKKKNNLIDNLLKDLSNNLIDKKDDPFLDGLEYLLHVYKYDEEYIYNPLKVNRLLKKDLNETRAMSGRTVAKHALDTKKEVRRRSLIKYMYKALNEEQDITHLSVIWTNEYLAALYMYTINKQKH